MDRSPGRIGFMSTQRRADRWQRRNCAERAEAAKIFFFALFAWLFRACANVLTAPPQLAAWLATNSLQLDYRFVQLVCQDVGLGSPPSGAAVCSNAYPATIHESPLSLISTPIGCSRLHPSLPQVPAGLSRRAERYDGKRDLYLQHAA